MVVVSFPNPLNKTALLLAAGCWLRSLRRLTLRSKREAGGCWCWGCFASKCHTQRLAGAKANKKESPILSQGRSTATAPASETASLWHSEPRHAPRRNPTEHLGDPREAMAPGGTILPKFTQNHLENGHLIAPGRLIPRIRDLELHAEQTPSPGESVIHAQIQHICSCLMDQESLAQRPLSLFPSPRTPSDQAPGLSGS